MPEAADKAQAPASYLLLDFLFDENARSEIVDGGRPHWRAVSRIILHISFEYSLCMFLF